MRRRLARVAASIPALAVGAAAALGLGEIDVSSRLNQRFVASIPLYDVSAEELAKLRVGLASNAEFERAGLERPAFLSSLRFEVMGDGRPRIDIRSDEVAREPVLTLLLNVSEGGSRVAREYTVLLDPPDYRAAGTDSTRFYETATEAQRGAPPAAAPTAAPVVAEPPPRPAATPAPAAEAEAPQGTADLPGRYGPVGAQETLWSIATRLRPPAATMDQILLALYRANPQAFDRGINGLLKGALLTVPSSEEVLSVSPAAAREEVMRLRGEPRAAAAPSPRPEATALPTAPPTPTPTAVATPEPTPPAEPLTAAEVPPPSLADLFEADQPAEQVEPSPAIESRLYEETSGGEVAVEPTPPAVVPSDADEFVEDLPARPAPSSSLAGTLLIPLALGLLVLGGIAVLVTRLLARRKQAAAPLPAAGSGRLVPRPAAGAKPAAAATAAAATTEVRAKTPTRDEFAELEALQATLEAEAAAGGTDTAQLATAQLDRPQPASTAASAATEQFPAVEFDTAAPAATAGDNVDFDLTGQFESQTVQINLDANDPVSEADFHLAYGLYDEAALLLRQAIERDPGRNDLHMKLAETYFAAGKPAEFQACAETLKSRLGATEWQKISIMGQQLVPGAPLFGDGGSADAAGGDVDLDLGGGDAPAPAAARDQPGLDFKIDELDVPDVDAPALKPATVDKGEALEFDLSEFDLAAADAGEAPAAQPAGERAGVDFDLDFAGFDAPAAAPASAPATPDRPPGDIGSAGEIRLDDIDLGDAGLGEGTGVFDEAATKLDLARAYVDMGDNEMARSLLDEVLAQGSEQQKTDARALIDRLG
jgi:pilus assembly protein FimV